MDTKYYAFLDGIQERHWWYAARRTILECVLQRITEDGVPSGKLYDLGCGVGANLPVLEKFGPTLGIDLSPEAIEFCRRRGRNNVALANLNDQVILPDNSGSVAMLADVVEHLDDPLPCLEAAHRALKPGGALLVTVPAYMFLWGPSDIVAHHKRRYTAAKLRKLLEPLFEVEHVTYFNTLLFGLIAAGRFGELLLRRSGNDGAKLPPAFVNSTLEAIFRAEASIVPRKNLPFGVSLLGVARKR